MDYFSILNLDREPYSNSPDPDFFYQSRQHVDCLQKLELALRLKRGLNIVIGAVGAGKTTLCRTLLKNFAPDNTIEAHLILDPSFSSPVAFLESIFTMIVGREISSRGEHQLKEQIKHHLFKKGVDEKKTVILIIDEGQKLPHFCFEILREFLNYETNDHKLLQIVVLAQEEFQEILNRRANLADRVNLIHFLGPMSVADTGKMINFRLRHASSQPHPPKLFTALALRAIYHATGGYPRKIINLCHQCMLALIVQNRSRVGWRLVRSCTVRSRAQRPQRHQPSWTLVFSILALFFAIVTVVLVASGRLPSISFSDGNNRLSATLKKERPSPTKTADLSTSEMPIPKKLPVAAVPPAVPLQSADERPLEPENDTSSSSPPTGSLISDKPAISDPSHERTTSDALPGGKEVLKPLPPLLLGAVSVEKNDTLGLMVKVIYGEFRQRYLEAVLDANPHIRHADAIRVGDTIAFPASPIPFDQRPYPLWWLKVGEADSLGTAFRRAINISEYKDGPLIRMIPVWYHQTGMSYGIFVLGYFFNLSAAETMLAQLPAGLSESAEIITGWPAGTILFCDPFIGKGY